MVNKFGKPTLVWHLHNIILLYTHVPVDAYTRIIIWTLPRTKTHTHQTPGNQTSVAYVHPKFNSDLEPDLVKKGTDHRSQSKLASAQEGISGWLSSQTAATAVQMNGEWMRGWRLHRGQVQTGLCQLRLAGGGVVVKLSTDDRRGDFCSTSDHFNISRWQTLVDKPDGNGVDLWFLFLLL